MSPRMGIDQKTVIEAAAEIADQHGLEAVTLASLAKKLSIRSPSLYNHVHGLPDLRNKIAIYGIERLKEELTKAAVGRSGDAAVRALSEAYIRFARERPGLYEATLSAPDSTDPDYQRVSSDVVGVLVRVMEWYGLKDDKALHSIRCFRSLLHGFASLEQKGGFGLPLDLDETLRMLVDTFLAGVRTIQENKTI